MDNPLSTIVAQLVQGAEIDDIGDFAMSFIAEVGDEYADEIKAFFESAIGQVNDDMLDHIQVMITEERAARAELSGANKAVSS